MPSGIYFVPGWTSKGPGWRQDLIDGAFSWNVWPDGPNNMTTAPDQQWQAALKPAGKSYMMGVSPWFYTNLPGWGKAWTCKYIERWKESDQGSCERI